MHCSKVLVGQSNVPSTPITIPRPTSRKSLPLARIVAPMLCDEHSAPPTAQANWPRQFRIRPSSTKLSNILDRFGAHDAQHPQHASLMLAVATTVLLAGTTYSQPPTMCDQPLVKSIAEMYERISRLPGATVAQSQDPLFDVINLEPQGQLWNFTKATHPAYPSLACRRIVLVEGQLRVQTELRCNAARAECDRLAADYGALDRQMMEPFKREAPK
jgi:hypothetical protein